MTGCMNASHQRKPEDELILQLVRRVLLILGAGLANYNKKKKKKKLHMFILGFFRVFKN